MKYTQNNAGDISRLRIHDSAFTGFDYRAEQSSVNITCRNEYLCKTYPNGIQKCNLHTHAVMQILGVRQ